MPPKKSQKKKVPGAKVEEKKTSFFMKLIKYGVPAAAVIFIAVSAIGYRTLSKYTNALNDALSSRIDTMDDDLSKKIEDLIIRNNNDGIVIDKDTLGDETFERFLKTKNGKKFLKGIMKIVDSELTHIIAIAGVPDIILKNPLISNVIQSILEYMAEHVIGLYATSQEAVMDNYYENEARQRMDIQSAVLLRDADSSNVSGYQWPNIDN